MSKEHPILFSAPMVRAILEGRKTQTRRVAKLNAAGRVQRAGRQWHVADAEAWRASPYGVPGERLWVRETHARAGCKTNCGHLGCHTIYRADEARAIGAYGAVKWTPAIHMPRWASRISLWITGMRVERLQEISEQDSADEGVGALVTPSREGNPDQYRQTYRDLWGEINGAESWAANPLVWVVEFHRVPTAK